MRITSRAKRYAVTLLLVMAIGAGAIGTTRIASAETALETVCAKDGGEESSICKTKKVDCSSAQLQVSDPACKSDNPIIVTILKAVRVLNYVIGAAAVISIMIGGLRYILSGGDSGHVESAKNTILYAVVGIVIAIISQGLVVFVLNRI